MKTKSVVLLSGGLDSTVNLYEALLKTEVVQVITIDYGQRALEKELQASRKLCQINNLDHQVMDLRWLKDLSASAITNDEGHIPTVEVQIDDLKQSQLTAKRVWVPNRNGLFLNLAATVAESLEAQFVIPGFNAEEAKTFPDNSLQFIDALNQAFSFSTANQVKVNCYTSELDKTQIVKRGIELKVPFNLIWPCYFDGQIWCGKCESCLRSARAFAANGLNFKGLQNEN